MFGPLGLYTIIAASGSILAEELGVRKRNAELDAKWNAMRVADDPERDRVQSELVRKYYSHDENGNYYYKLAREQNRPIPALRGECIRRVMHSMGLVVNEQRLYDYIH